ncbi:unnamed protein product [Symbiodinium sp. CCMP2592]|nr:unnamed protein product [Symbiodinium sp. CCMP2592]
MEALLGTTLLHGTAQVATSSLQGGVVALYFSAGWCPPCKGFTPQFRKVYEHAKSKNRAFDVVFVSGDRDETSFREYFGKMPWHALPFADRQRQQQLSAKFGIRGIPSVVLLSSSGQLLDASARGKVMESGFVLSLPRCIDLASAALSEPSGAVQLQLRYKGCEYDIECEPSEGWEMLRMQIYSMIDVPSEQLKLFGLGLDKGQLDESISLPQALARGIAAQKNSGLQLAKVPLEGRRASSSHDDDKPGQRHHTGTLDSASAWCSKRDDCSPWYQLDLGEVGNVAGVVLASRADCGQWVTRFRVELADSEDGPWTSADDGREFDGPGYALPVRAVFQNGSQLARFVRILPLSHRNHCSLRADLLLATGEPDKPPVIVALGNFSEGDPFESETPEVPMDAMMEEQHLAMLQAKLSSLPPKLQNQVGSLATVQGYEMKPLQRQALDEIPVLALDAAVDPSESYEISFMRMAAFATLAFVFGGAIGANFASVSEDGSMLRQFAGIRFGSRSAMKTRMQDFARQELLFQYHSPPSAFPSDKLRSGAACALLVVGGLWLLRVATGHLEFWAASVDSLLSLKSVAAGSPLLAAGCGAGAGALHTLSGPDHLAALAPLALRVRKGPGAAFRTGMFWGSGHVAGQLLLGSGLLLLSRSLPRFQLGLAGLAEQLASLAVGFVLMTIGALGIKESRDWDEDQNQRSVQTSFSWKTFGTGMLSGMRLGSRS